MGACSRLAGAVTGEPGMLRTKKAESPIPSGSLGFSGSSQTLRWWRWALLDGRRQALCRKARGVAVLIDTISVTGPRGVDPAMSREGPAWNCGQGDTRIACAPRSTSGSRRCSMESRPWS